MNTPNAYAPPKANVADVSPGAELTLASRLSRLGAALLDGIIVGAFVYTPLVVTGAAGRAAAEAVRAGNPLAFWGVFASGAGLASCALFLVWAVITFRLVAANGQTIAKKLIGIKVVRSDGSRATVARIFWLRNVVNGLISAIPIIGYFYALADALFIFSERRQCLHDRIADTIVVDAGSSPADPPGVSCSPRAKLFPDAAFLPVCGQFAYRTRRVTYLRWGHWPRGRNPSVRIESWSQSSGSAAFESSSIRTITGRHTCTR
jgi:uncharacterized RDD family membrane protein YckC